MSNGSITQLQRTLKHIVLTDILPQPVMVKNTEKILKHTEVHLSNNDSN